MAARPRAVLALLLALCLGAAALGALVLLPASPARAASALQLSSDGVNFSSSFEGNVFQADGRVVPGDALHGRFWVRNAGSSAAYLRVGLADMTIDNQAYISALTLQTSVAGTPVTVKPLNGVARCGELSQARGMQPGEVVQVDTEIGFTNVTGTGAQAATAEISYVVSLSDVDPTVVWTPLCSPAAPPDVSQGAVAGAHGWIGEVSGSLSLNGARTVPNTVQDYAEYAILILVAAALGGVGMRLYAHRRWEQGRRGERG